MKQQFITQYRPESLDDVKGHKDIINEIQRNVEDENLSNMIFYGPAGTGKTTTAKAIAKEVYGDEYERNFMELNASDENGIDVIRGKVKKFARQQGIDKSFKIMFLDEADALSKEAQQGLRRVMEDNADKCIFILSCNFEEKLLDPIKSRCSVYNFSALNKQALLDQLEEVIEDNGMHWTDEAKEKLAEEANGDMRRILSKAQNMSTVDGKVTKSDIVSDKTEEGHLEILKAVSQGSFTQAREKTKEYLEQGYTERQLLRRLYEFVLDYDEMADDTKAKMINQIAKTDADITNGATKRVQLDAMLYRLVQISSDL